MFARGVILAAIGVATGLAIAFAVSRSLATLLFGITSNDSVSFTAAAVSIFAVAMVASYLPARSAAVIEPAITLRNE